MSSNKAEARPEKFNPARRQFSPGVLAKIKAEIDRLSGPDRPEHIQRFAHEMLRQYPELANL